MTATPRKRRRFGCLVRSLAVVLVVAGAAYATRSRALFPALARLAERYVESHFDADLSIRGLGGNGWTTLDAEHVRLSARAGSTTRLRAFDARKLELRLSVYALLRGRAGWLESVRANTLNAEIDLTQPGSDEDEPDEARDVQGRFPAVDVEQLTGWVVLDEVRRLDVTGGSLRSRPTPDGPGLSLVDLSSNLRLAPDGTPYGGRITADAVLADDQLLVETARLDGDQIHVEAKDVRVPWSSLTADRILDDMQAELQVEIDGLLARFGARGLERPSHITATGGLRGGALIIDGAELDAAGGRVIVTGGRVEHDAERRLDWALGLDCDFPRLETLIGLLGSAGWTGALKGHASVEGLDTEAVLALRVDAERLQLADLRFGTGSLAGSIAMDLRRPADVTGRAAVRAAPAWIAGREISELTGDIELSKTELRIVGLHAAQPGNVLDVPDLVLPRTSDPARMLDGARGRLDLSITRIDRAALLPPRDEPLPEHEIAVSATIARGIATLTDARVEFAGGSLRAGRGTLRLSRNRSDVRLDLGATIDFPDIAPLGALLGEPELAGRLDGDLRAGGALDDPTLVFDITGSDVFVRGFDLTEIALAGRLARDGIDVERLRAVSRHATIETAGSFSTAGDRTAGRFDALRIAREDRELALRAPFAFEHTGSLVTIEPFVLEGTAGSLELALKRDGGRWSADAHAVDLDLDQVLPERGLGHADGHVKLERTDEDTRFEVDASFAGWRVPGFEGLVDAQLDLEQTGDALTVRRLELQAADGVRVTFTGRAPLDWLALISDEAADPAVVLPDGELSFHATSESFPLSRIAWESPWDDIMGAGKASVVADVTGTWSAPRGRVDVDVDGLRWTGVRDLPIGRLSARLALEENAVSARIATDQPARFAAEGGMRVGAPVDAIALARGEIEPLLTAPLELDLDVSGEDLAWLPVRVAGVRRSAGAVRADLNLRGAIAAPIWGGTIAVSGGELKLDSDLPSLVGVEGELALEDHAIKLRSLVAELGGAPISAEGEIAFPVHGSPNLNLSFHGERLLLRRDPEVLLRADADLDVTGTWSAPLLSGRLDLRRSWLSKRVTLLDLNQQLSGRSAGARGIPLFSFHEPPFRDMTLDLAVTSSESIVLRGNVARGGLRPALRIAGTGEVPRLEGAITLDPTAVTLPGATVNFRGGTLTFEPANPFVPRLQLVGQTEKFGHTITAVVTGPYDEPEVELSASPPLSQEDIVLILLAGRPPSGVGTGAIEATQSLAIYLAQDFASAWLGGDGDASFLERVEVVTGRDVSRNGVPTIEIRLRVGDDFPVGGGNVYLSGERDVYEDSNMGLRFAFRLR